MKISGNTIFITGGGSGIGRGLAEALHKAGNQVIISGRRREKLNEVTGANPGMKSAILDIEDPASIASVAKTLIEQNPKLNVLINNAGIMQVEKLDEPHDDAAVTSVIQTNLYGPIRMTSALIKHLKAQPEATVINVTSGLAFIPLAMTPTYCATKAALHSYSHSLRFQLRETSVKVLELAPPYVQTELMGEQQKTDPRAMPLDAFIDETMALLAGDKDEILVQNVMPLRTGVGIDEGAFVTKFNNMMSGH